MSVDAVAGGARGARPLAFSAAAQDACAGHGQRRLELRDERRPQRRPTSASAELTTRERADIGMLRGQADLERHRTLHREPLRLAVML